MKAAKSLETQRAFILKQVNDCMPVAEICRKAGISQATCFDWKKNYDGLLPTEMRRLKQLEDVNGNRSQSAVSTHVRQLEEGLGVPLLMRIAYRTRGDSDDSSRGTHSVQVVSIQRSAKHYFCAESSQ